MRRAAGGPRSWVAAALVLAALVLAAPAASAAPGTIFFTAGSPTPGVAQLWSVREDGARLELLRRRMPVTPEGGAAVLARDGKRVFCICREGEVSSVRTDGTHLRRLYDLPRGSRYDVVTLSPTGSAFWVKGGKWIIGVKPGAKPRKVASFRRGIVIDERVVPSPDGRRLAVVAYGPAADTESLLTVRLGGGERTLVYQGSGLAKEIWDAAWSPNGRQLVFSDGTGEGDPKGELPVSYPRQWFLAPSDGSNPAGTPLPLSEGTSNPSFSPDGTRLAFTVNWGDGPQLTIAGLDGIGPQTVPNTVCRSYCEFAPQVVGWARR